MKRAELKDIHKIYETSPDGSGTTERFTALDGVTLAFLPGEIHTILGENGAGKSTLVHILSGLHAPTQGCVRIGDQEFCFRSPSEALSAGIAMVHQRPLLCDEISVLENILLGGSGLFLHRAACGKKVADLLARWESTLDLSAPARSLNPAGRLYAALFGALYREPDFLILDEPTAVLSPDERELFFRSLQTARARGLGIILITHKLEEAARWSDRVSILRQGKLVYTASVRMPPDSMPVTEELLENLLDPDHAKIGRKHTVTDSEAHPGTEDDKKADRHAFTATGITAEPGNRNPVRDITFSARAGKITGIIGLPGSGIETLEDVLSGMIRATKGTLALGPVILSMEEITPALLRRQGAAIVPSDRSFRASHPDLTILEMLVPYRRNGFFTDRPADLAFARRILEAEQIEAAPDRLVKTLSGGQLQRLILARELSTRPQFLILAEPEWGLDIRSTELLRQRLSAAAESGMTILVLTDNADSIHERDFYDDTRILKDGSLS